MLTDRPFFWRNTRGSSKVMIINFLAIFFVFWSKGWTSLKKINNSLTFFLKIKLLMLISTPCQAKDIHHQILRQMSSTSFVSPRKKNLCPCVSLVNVFREHLKLYKKCFWRLKSRTILWVSTQNIFTSLCIAAFCVWRARDKNNFSFILSVE